ncbi:MAG: ArsA family ATPase [Dehalococcoidia bacterium]
MNEKSVIMFGGKGGVGKTTCAAATALHNADNGRVTLAISTDPTPSLFNIFEIQSEQKRIKATDNLWVSELGADEVKEMWDREFGPQVYEVFSTLVSIGYEEFVDFITSILPGLQEEFMVDYIRNLAESGMYDSIVWDTAPLGQTMQLLNMPEMLREHLRPAPRIYSRLKLGSSTRRPIIKILEEWSELSAKDIRFLRDKVEFNMVTIPEALAVDQLDGVFAECERHGFEFSTMIVNNVIKSPDSDFLRRKAGLQEAYLAKIRQKCAGLEMLEVPWFPYEVKGVDGLKELGGMLFAAV